MESDSRLGPGSYPRWGRFQRRARLGLAIGTMLALVSACAPAPAGPGAAPSQLASAAAPGPGVAPAPEQVTFSLDYILYGGHAPYFLAQERGYFAERGLDVNIVEGKQGDLATKPAVADLLTNEFVSAN